MHQAQPRGAPLQHQPPFVSFIPLFARSPIQLQVGSSSLRLRQILRLIHSGLHAPRPGRA